MAITGNQKAYLQARSGISRSGATRTGFYSYGVSLLWQQWNGTTWVNTNMLPYIEHGSLSVHESLNDEIDTASFTLLPSVPIVPKAGEPITISMGGTGAGTVIFAGHCVRIRQRWVKGTIPEGSWWDVECVDHLFTFDAGFVTNEYTSTKGADIIRDVVDRVVADGFTLGGVDPNLPVIPSLPVTNQRPSTVLRAVTNAAGGAFFIAPNKEIHAWGANGDIRYATPPRPLTEDLKTLKHFGITFDASQVRTLVRVEGQRTDTPPAIPPPAAPTDPSQGLVSVPLTDGTMFEKTPHGGEWPVYWLARIGTQDVSYRAAYGRIDPSLNQPGTLVSQAANPGDPVLYVQTVAVILATGVEGHGWIEVANQAIAWTVSTDGQYLMIPPTGYGSIQGPIPAGSMVNAMPILYDVDVNTAGLRDQPRWHSQPPGQAVVTVNLRRDIPAEIRWQQLSGSLGFRTHLIQDGRLSRAGAEARGDVDLAEFKDPRYVIEWETDDLNAEVGRPQAVDLLGYEFTLTITNVDLTWPISNRPPRRVCRAATVRSAGLLDLLLTDPR